MSVSHMLGLTTQRIDAFTAGIGIYLPVLREGTAPQQNRKDHRNPCRGYDHKSGVDTLAVNETILQMDVSKTQVGFSSDLCGPHRQAEEKSAHGRLDNPQ